MKAQHQTINGMPVLAMVPVPRMMGEDQGYILLVDLKTHPLQKNAARYATALWFDGRDEWQRGAYFNGLDSAAVNLGERVRSFIEKGMAAEW